QGLVHATDSGKAAGHREAGPHFGATDGPIEKRFGGRHRCSWSTRGCDEQEAGTTSADLVLPYRIGDLALGTLRQPQGVVDLREAERDVVEASQRDGSPLGVGSRDRGKLLEVPFGLDGSSAQRCNLYRQQSRGESPTPLDGGLGKAGGK